MSEQKWITITVPCEVRSAGGAGKAGTWTEHDGRKGVWVARSEQEVLIWHEDLHRSIDRAAWPSGSTVDWQDRVLAEALLIPISAQQEERERCAAEIVRYGIPAVAFAIDRAWNEGADAERAAAARAAKVTPTTDYAKRLAEIEAWTVRLDADVIDAMAPEEVANDLELAVASHVPWLLAQLRAVETALAAAGGAASAARDGTAAFSTGRSAAPFGGPLT